MDYKLDHLYLQWTVVLLHYLRAVNVFALVNGYKNWSNFGQYVLYTFEIEINY